MNAHNKVGYLIPLAIFTLMLVSVPGVKAADIYVTPVTNSPIGDGTKNLPYNSIAVALKAAQPGDTVKLLAGTYFETISFPHGGTVGNPITIMSDGPARSAVIDCQNASVNCVETNYGNVVIDGLEVKNAGINGIKVDGDLNGHFDPLQSYGRYAGNSSRYNYANGADNIIIQNNYVHHIGYDGLKISHTNNIQLMNNEIYKTGTVHFTTPNMWQQGIDMVGVYNSVIHGNYIHDDLVNPIMAIGLFVKGGSENIIIEDNVVENIASPNAGIEVGGDTEWYNTRYNPAEVPGLNDRTLTEDYNNNEVDMTGIYAAATTYTNQYMSEARNCIVRGNKIFNADPPISFRNAYNTKVYNNTIIDSGWSQGWIKLWNDGNKYHRTQNTLIYNNMFLNRTVALTTLGRYRDKSIGTGYDNWIGFEADNNLVYNMGNVTVMGLGTVVVVDTHSVFADPDLDTEYRPLVGSVVVDKGIDLVAKGLIDGTYTDKYGVTVPQGLYDIGAYEYSTDNSNVPVVALTAPSNNDVVSGTVIINATATDNVGVTKVEFYVSGVLVNTETTAPYSYNWDTTAFANGAYTIKAKSYDADGNVGQSDSIAVTVNNPIIPDAISPTVNLLTPLNNATVSGTVYVSANATDNVGVKKFEIFVDSDLVAVMNTTPYSFNLNTSTIANGLHVFTAMAYDAAGNVGQSSAVTVMINNPLPDLTAPVVTSFVIPATAAALAVPVTSFSASDNVEVTGYLISESSVAPAASAAGWTSSAPTWFNFSASGSKTAYAWTKDAAGNVSASLSSSVVITIPDFSGLSLNTDTTAPVVNTFIMPVTATTTTVAISSLTATDNVGVTGYLVTESSAAPTASTSGWTTFAPTSFTFSGAGSKTAYAWAKDAAGKISASLSRAVVITLPDTTAPTVATFTAPLTATTLSVAISLTATDNIGVIGYMVNESASAPSASTAGWSASAPSSYTFTTTGTKTLYAWAKDAAGNVSVAKMATIVVSIPKTVSQDVIIFGSSTTFPTIQDAYNTVPESGTIAAKDVTLSEQLNFNRAVTVNLAGGMDASFQPTTGSTAVSGVIKISSGKVVVSKIVIR